MATAQDDDLDELDDLHEELESQGIYQPEEGYGSPEPHKKDSNLVFYRQLIRADDSKKFANLDQKELGFDGLSVRDCLAIAQYADAEGLDEVGDYLRERAENILSTSLSKKGFFAQLFVTTIKKESKIKTGGGEPVKRGFFGKKEEVPNE